MREDPKRPAPLIVTPTGIEYAAVRKGLNRWLERGEIHLSRCGVGERRARLFCQQANPGAITGLVLLGWAGGLVPGLAAGDILCADAALRDGQPRVECQVLPIPRSQSGPILTVPRALLTPEEKRSARTSGALAVEMEAYPLAEWAATRGIPFIHARVILDTWDESLPDLGPENASPGRMPVLASFRRLSRLAGLLPDMWSLYRRIRWLNPILEKLSGDITLGMGFCAPELQDTRSK